MNTTTAMSSGKSKESQKKDARSRKRKGSQKNLYSVSRRLVNNAFCTDLTDWSEPSRVRYVDDMLICSTEREMLKRGSNKYILKHA